MKCQSCGAEFTQEDIATLNVWCPDCRNCPSCGSAFLVRYVTPGKSEARCMSCLHHETKGSTALSIPAQAIPVCGLKLAAPTTESQEER